MKEFVFYYHVMEWEKIKEDGTYIWYYATCCSDIMMAIKEFAQYGGEVDSIIQIIVTGKLPYGPRGNNKLL